MPIQVGQSCATKPCATHSCGTWMRMEDRGICMTILHGFIEHRHMCCVTANDAGSSKEAFCNAHSGLGPAEPLENGRCCIDANVLGLSEERVSDGWSE